MVLMKPTYHHAANEITWQGSLICWSVRIVVAFIRLAGLKAGDRKEVVATHWKE